MVVNKGWLFARDGFVGLSAGIWGGCGWGMTTFVVVVAGITKSTSFSLRWGSSGQMFSRTVLCSTVSAFSTWPSSLIMVTIANAARSTLVVTRRSSRGCVSTFSLASAVAARPLLGLSPASSSALLKRQTHRLTELSSTASSPYTLRRHLLAWALRSKKFSHQSLRIVRTSKTSAILHCYCVERTWLTRAPMILVELDNVAIRWSKKENLHGARL